MKELAVIAVGVVASDVVVFLVADHFGLTYPFLVVALWNVAITCIAQVAALVNLSSIGRQK